MPLHEQILSDYKTAFKEKNAITKDILNYLIAQLKYKKIELMKDLNDDDVIKVIKKEIKSRQESITFLEKSNKIDEIQTDTAKIEILKKYLPAMMSENELQLIIAQYIQELNITDKHKEKGKLIGTIMKSYGTQIDTEMLHRLINS